MQCDGLSRCVSGLIASISLNFGDRGEAAVAKRGVRGALADVRRVIPAALAFLAVGALHAYLQAFHAYSRRAAVNRTGCDLNSRNDEERRKLRGVFLQ